MNHVVHGRLNPFLDCGPPLRFEAEAGRTVAEIVASAPGLPDWFWHSGEVRINGHVLARGAWHITKPKLSTSLRPIIITLHASYQGGGGDRGGGRGGGSKNVFATVAAIALVAGAALVSGGLLGPAAAGTIGTGLFGASFAAGGTGAVLAAAGLSLGATLLLGTIAPPPSQQVAQSAGRDSANNQLTDAGINGNVVSPMEALPVVLGQIRTSPPLGAPPYTTLELGVVWANAVYVIAGHYDISEILLNGVDIDSFDAVEYQVREGSASDAVLTICNETVIERRNQNALLTNFVLQIGGSGGTTKLMHQDNPDQDLPQFQIFKTAGIADEIRLRFFWPAIQNSGTGAAAAEVAQVPIRIEIRERGESTWLKLPVTHWQAFRLNEQIRKEVRLKFVSSQPSGPRFTGGLHCAAAFYITGDGETFEYNAESYFAPITVTDQIPVMTAATTSGVTMSASSEDGGANHQAWRAADNAPTSTYWTPTGALPQWLKVDFGAGNPKTILSYLISSPDGEERLPRSWTLEGSNDDTNWTVLHTMTDYVPPNTATLTFQTETSGSYRYYRVNVSDTESTLRIQDFQLYLHDAPSSDSAAIIASHVHIHNDGIDIYLDTATFPLGEYEVRVQRGLGFNDADFVRDAYTYNADPEAANFFEYISGGSATVAFAQGAFSTDTLLESFATVSDDYPFDGSIHTKGVAMIAVRAPSITLESLSAIFHSIVPVWSEARDWSDDAATSNPAALARHILLSTEQNAEALPGELIDEQAFQDFFEFCADEGHEHNGVMDGMSVIEAYRQVLAAGYAAPDWNGFWGVIYEHDRSAETPVQLFTPANTRGLTVNRTFPKLPHAFRPIFFDEDDDFNINEASLVYMDGFSADNATRIEELNLPGWTDATKVAERALFDLRQLYLRPVRYSFEIGLEGLVCQRGDLVRLRHDVISRYHDFSRIVSVQRSGGNITGLTLESEVDLTVATGEVTEDMAAGIQYADRTTTTQQVNEKTLTDVVTFTTPFPDPDDGKTDEADFILVPGMIVGFGVVNTEEENMVVLWYEYVDELTRRITLVDEARGLHA